MASRPTRAPRSLPRGRHPAPREVVLLSQRERLLEAVATIVATKGYVAATVADVVKEAGVSRATFYEHFTDKEACFLACYDRGTEVVLDAIAEATSEHEDPLARHRAGLRAYLKALDASPAEAQVGLIDIVAAGERALERRAEVHARYVALLRGTHTALQEKYRGVPDLSDDVLAGLVAGGNELVVRRLLRGAGLRDLEPEILYLQLSVMGLTRQARAILDG